MREHESSKFKYRQFFSMVKDSSYVREQNTLQDANLQISLDEFS